MGSLSTVTVGRPVLAAGIPHSEGTDSLLLLEENSHRAYCHTCCVAHSSHDTSLGTTPFLFHVESAPSESSLISIEHSASL